MFRERAFSFFQGTLETTGAETGSRTGAGMGAGAGARASRTALRICCKSSLEYLGTLVLVEDFGSRDLSGCLEISDLGGKKESRRVIGGATEGAIEGGSWRGRPRPQTEIFLELELIFF